MSNRSGAARSTRRSDIDYRESPVKPGGGSRRGEIARELSWSPSVDVLNPGVTPHRNVEYDEKPDSDTKKNVEKFSPTGSKCNVTGQSGEIFGDVDYRRRRVRLLARQDQGEARTRCRVRRYEMCQSKSTP